MMLFNVNMSAVAHQEVCLSLPRVFFHKISLRRDPLERLAQTPSMLENPNSATKGRGVIVATP